METHSTEYYLCDFQPYIFKLPDSSFVVLMTQYFRMYLVFQVIGHSISTDLMNLKAEVADSNFDVPIIWYGDLEASYFYNKFK